MIGPAIHTAPCMHCKLTLVAPGKCHAPSRQHPVSYNRHAARALANTEVACLLSMCTAALQGRHCLVLPCEGIICKVSGTQVSATVPTTVPTTVPAIVKRLISALLGHILLLHASRPCLCGCLRFRLTLRLRVPMSCMTTLSC